MDGLGAILDAGQLTLSGLLLLGVLLVFLGLLIPRSTVRTLIAGKDAEIERALKIADDWHAAHTTSEAAREIITGHNRELIEIARTFEVALRDQAGPGRVSP